MKITLEREGREPMKAEVEDTDGWVSDVLSLTWNYANYTGGPITAVDDKGHKIVTVSIEYHDE